MPQLSKHADHKFQYIFGRKALSHGRKIPGNDFPGLAKKLFVILNSSKNVENIICTHKVKLQWSDDTYLRIRYEMYGFLKDFVNILLNTVWNE